LVVLFIILIRESYGEREHALSFANQLGKTDFTPLFFIDPHLSPFFADKSYKYYSSNLLEDLKSVIDKEKPALIISCEYFSQPLKIREYLLNLSIPLASMDGSSIGRIYDMDAGQVNEKLILLRPCPVNDICPDTEKIKYWNIFPAISKNQENPVISSLYNIEPGAKTVFMSIAPWTSMAVKLINLEHFYKYTFDTLFTILEKYEEPVHFFIICQLEQNSYNIKRKNLTVHFLNYLEYELYEKLLLSAHLVISDNVIQTTLSKAFMAVINTLVLINSIEDPVMKIPKYNIFPLPLIFPEERQYYQAVNKAEILDKEDIKNKVIKLLDSVQPTPEYIKNVRQLKAVNEIVKEIIG
jgi:hypothetical protein